MSDEINNEALNSLEWGKPIKRRSDDIPQDNDKRLKSNEEILNKIIEDKYLEFYEPEYDESKGKVLYYRKLKFQGKRFTLFSKTKDLLKYNNLYYYCINHRKTKTSTNQDKKGFKIRISICHAKIKFEKDKNKYIYCNSHSKACEELIKEKYLNYREVKKEINNYDMFKNELIEYLKKYPVISFTDFKKYGNEVYNKSE